MTPKPHTPFEPVIDLVAPADLQPIRGSGIMADLIRAHDWDNTPVGPIATWPEDLLGPINLMLSCRFPMVIFWGANMIQFYNDAYLPLMAEKHPAALGQPAEECWQEAWHIIGPQFEAALTRGVTAYQENVLVPVLREERLRDVYWTYSYSPIYSASGSIAGILVVCHDVTEEVLTKQERDAVSERLNQVLNATTDAILSLDRNWRITYLNPRASEILAPSGNILGSNLWEIFPYIVYENSPYTRHYLQAMERKIAGEFEAFYPEPLNIWLKVDVRPTNDGIVIFFRDITARKHTEASMRESAARLDAIYNSSIEYIGLLATDGTLLDCNRASLDFAGNTREQVLGMRFWNTPWFQYTPGAPALVRDAVVRAARGEHIRHAMPLTRPSGEIITFDFSISPARNQNGKVVFLVPEGHDITVLKRAETALLQSEKLAAVGRLASSIAHEINNPLESVTNLLYLARNSSQVEQIQDYLDTAERELRRVSAISNQTLRFYRQSTKPRPVAAGELIESVLSIHQGRIVNSRVQVVERHRASGSVICFDGEIQQVLINLIGNAIDAIPPTGGRLLVRSREGTQWSAGRKGLVFTIADTGAGIEPQNLRKIFDPFFTTKGLGGTGLGLWVSQEIMDRHNGTIRIRSKAGNAAKGTVFRVFLPFDAVAPRPPQPDIPAPR